MEGLQEAGIEYMKKKKRQEGSKTIRVSITRQNQKRNEDGKECMYNAARRDGGTGVRV